MTKEAHRLRETDARAVRPSNRGPSRAMKPDVRKPGFLAEKPRPIPSALQKFQRREIPGYFVTSFDQVFHQGNKPRAKRGLIDDPAFAANDDRGRRLRVQIEISLQIDPRFAEPASLRNRDFKTDSHPFRARDQAFPDRFLLLDRNLMDVAQRLPAKPKAQAWIGSREFPAHRFVHNDAQNFDIGRDGSGRDRPFTLFRFASTRCPTQINELHDGVMVKTGWEFYAEFVQDGFDRAPSRQVAVACFSGIGVMRFEPCAHPDLPFVIVAGSRNLFLFVSFLSAKLAGGARFFATLPSKPCRMTSALARSGVAKANLPKLGIINFLERRQNWTQPIALCPKMSIAA